MRRVLICKEEVNLMNRAPRTPQQVHASVCPAPGCRNHPAERLHGLCVRFPSSFPLADLTFFPLVVLLAAAGYDYS